MTLQKLDEGQEMGEEEQGEEEGDQEDDYNPTLNETLNETSLRDQRLFMRATSQHLSPISMQCWMARWFTHDRLDRSMILRQY